MARRVRLIASIALHGKALALNQSFSLKCRRTHTIIINSMQMARERVYTAGAPLLP